MLRCYTLSPESAVNEWLEINRKEDDRTTRIAAKLKGRRRIKF